MATDYVTSLRPIYRREWCARWGDTCVPDSPAAFANCCDGLLCSCGAMWQGRRCQCKKPSIFGRR